MRDNNPARISQLLINQISGIYHNVYTNSERFPAPIFYIDSFVCYLALFDSISNIFSLIDSRIFFLNFGSAFIRISSEARYQCLSNVIVYKNREERIKWNIYHFPETNVRNSCTLGTTIGEIKAWILILSLGSSPARYSHQYWAPVVANHFPPTSPFTQGQNLGYSLLPQGVQFSPPRRAPLMSHPPLTRQRSGGAGGDYTLLPQTPKLDRKRSKKGTREVSSVRKTNKSRIEQ